MIQATRVADPASVGVFIGAAPLVIIIAAAITARHRPTRRVLLAAAVVTAGSAAAQLGGATGPALSPAGLLWSAGALGGAVGTSLLAAPCCPGSAPSPSPSTLAAWPACCCWPPPPWPAPPADPDPAHPHRDPAGRAGLPHHRGHRPGVPRLVRAIQRLGVDRTGLFNGLIPVTSLAAVALTGTGTVTPFGLLGALAVLAGVILGLSRASQVPARTVNQAGQRPRPSAETTPVSPHSQPALSQRAVAGAAREKAAA